MTKETMSKQRMIIPDDQLLIDVDLLFGLIRSTGGDWQAVEKQMNELLASVQMSADDDSGAPAQA